MSKVNIVANLTEQEARLLRHVVACFGMDSFCGLRDSLDTAGIYFECTKLDRLTRNDLVRVFNITRKTVKVGDQEYYEDELAEALKNIKPL